MLRMYVWERVSVSLLILMLKLFHSPFYDQYKLLFSHFPLNDSIWWFPFYLIRPPSCKMGNGHQHILLKVCCNCQKIWWIRAWLESIAPAEFSDAHVKISMCKYCTFFNGTKKDMEKWRETGDDMFIWVAIFIQYAMIWLYYNFDQMIVWINDDDVCSVRFLSSFCAINYVLNCTCSHWA